jgi:hypothetical protein
MMSFKKPSNWGIQSGSTVGKLATGAGFKQTSGVISDTKTKEFIAQQNANLKRMTEMRQRG